MNRDAIGRLSLTVLFPDVGEFMLDLRKKTGECGTSVFEGLVDEENGRR
jgi:hypothetical protein